MLRLDVFDVLGKQLYSEKQFYPAGAAHWRLYGHDLPKGTLYIRVSTYGGTVRTIKLIREK